MFSLFVCSAASKLYTKCVPNACINECKGSPVSGQFCHTKRIFEDYINKLKQNSNVNFYSFSFANLSCVDKFINNNVYRTCFFYDDEVKCKLMSKIDDSVYLNDYGFHIPINATTICRFFKPRHW